MPPKTSRRPMSRGPMDQLRQSVAQRSAATASRGASDHEVAPPPLELQLITGQVPSTQHSSATSTFTTGRSFPRSIRCKSGDTSTSTSTSTHTRGIVVGKKTSEEVRKHGKIKLEWSDELKLPSSQVVQARLIRDIGSVVRGKVPMVAHSYWALPREHLQIVYNHISTYYDFSYENIALFEYIQKMASLRFINWMSECKEHFNTYGTDVPVEFVDRVDEWTWLMAHWSTEEAKARSEQMKAVRASDKKVNHSSGPVPFAYRAKKLKESGDIAPIPNTWVEVYKKNAPDAADAMTAAIATSISSFEASNPTPPPVEGGSDSTPPAPMTLPIETQINIVQGEVGVRRGTVIRGLGIGHRRDPQSKGGVRTSNPSEVEELRSTMARMQQEREQEAEEMRRFKAEQERANEEQRRKMEEQQRKMEDMEARLRLLFGGSASGGESTSRQQP
ncbi:hypothetical protein LguiB_003586 [Lonicera macranthoides]